MAATVAILLWLLIKLDRNYKVSRTVVVQVPISERPVLVNVDIEGSGYDLLYESNIDTIAAARLCIAPPAARGNLSMRWNLRELHQLGICQKLRRISYKPTLRWILPSGVDFVSPPNWLSDTIWTFADSLPPLSYELVAKIGYHRYAVPLPSHWGNYPETLWVEAHTAKYIYASVEVTPQAIGTENYALLLTPNRVQIRFWAPQSMADRWKPEDFQVIVDMRKVLAGDSVVFPELHKCPSYVRRVEITPSALSFTRVY
ncbi:MAG: hypothetical protein NZZ60_00165 [Bacteroidia bacterium]|nr:hypothetical protein [Bacteroidia bacterium]MDW8416351.1 hypothetical protein [Bacteroidia bacterium]